MSCTSYSNDDVIEAVKLLDELKSNSIISDQQYQMLIPIVDASFDPNDEEDT